MSKNIKAIIAVSTSDIIGSTATGQAIPWKLSRDFAQFKEKTKGGVVIMGRETWDSLPKKPLPGRINIVLSRNSLFDIADGYVASDKEAAVFTAETVAPDLPVWIIGGKQIYDLFADDIDEWHITTVYATQNPPDPVFAPACITTVKKMWKQVSTYMHRADEKNQYDAVYNVFTKPGESDSQQKEVEEIKK